MPMNDINKLGVDLGGSKIEVVLLDPAGNILHRERCPTPQGDYSATLDSVAKLLEATDKKAFHWAFAIRYWDTWLNFQP